MLRLFLRTLRKVVGARWLADAVPGSWYGVRGKSVIQAAWTRLAAARYLSDNRQLDTTAILFDVTKAFYHIQWPDLRESADTLGFPIDLLNFLIKIYSVPRLLMVAGLVASRVQPTLSVVAGCAFADCCMALIMVSVERIFRIKIFGEEAEVLTATVADDYQILVATSAGRRISTTIKVFQAASDAFTHHMLPVAAKKLAALTNRSWSSLEANRLPKSLKKAKTATTRNLGVDFTLGRARRTGVFDARSRNFKGKLKRVIKRRLKGGNTRQAVTNLVNATTCWGCEVIGCSPTQLSSRRRAAHSALVGQTAGRSATFDFALDLNVKWRTIDPAFRLCVAPIHALAQAVWDTWLLKGWIYGLWRSSLEKLAGRWDSSHIWSTVNHPVTAALLSAHRIGWTSPQPGIFMTAKGIDIDVCTMSPATVRTLANRDVEDFLLKRAAARYPEFRRFGPDAVPWVDPLRRATSMAGSASWDWKPQHQALVRTRAANGLWPPADLHKLDASINGMCDACGVPADNHHLDLTCFQLYSERGMYPIESDVAARMTRGRLASLGTYCLVPDPTRALTIPTVEIWRWLIEPSDGMRCFGNSTFGDASMAPGLSAWAGRAAYSVVQLGGCGA